MKRTAGIGSALSLAILVSTVLLLPSRAAGQSQAALTCEDWAAVSKWTGTIHLNGTGSSTDQNGNTYTVQESATVQFTTSSGPGNCGGDNFGWSWTAQSADTTYSVNLNVQVDTTCLDDSNHAHPSTVTYSVANGTYAFRGAQIGLDFSNPTQPAYFFTFQDTVDGVRISAKNDPACGPPGPPQVLAEPWGPGSLPQGIPAMRLPSSISTLQGSATFQASDFYEPGPATWNMDWTFTPTVDLDVVMSIQDYDTWRPTAGRSEKDFAGGLVVQAHLYEKSTNTPTDKVLADKWTFKLADVSHEPGVALNWPPKANLMSPAPADLMFDDLNTQVSYPGSTISTDGTQLDIPLNSDNLVTGVVVLLDSHDWGAWGTLNLTVMVGGQVIKAHFLNDTKTDILIPKRQQGSFIADSWKTAMNIPLDTPDADDSENDPVGDGNTGDGLTLYEEYRGFYMGCARSGGIPAIVGPQSPPCQHEEGDPKKKDLFIASELSAEQNLGIKKFKQETKLNVHYKGLSVQEIGTDRIINFNFGQGPHLKNTTTDGQHALHVLWEKGRNTSSAVGGPGTPRKIQGVFLASGDQNLATTTPGSGNGNNYYTATVAHELSHCVSVWHHGENDAGSVYWYADENGNVIETGATQKINDTTYPVFGTGTVVRVFAEDQDPRTATPKGPWALGLLKTCPAMDNSCPVSANGVQVNLGNRVCGTGVRIHAQHSGDQNCYMRYDNAEAYVPGGFPDVRYFPVDEVTGQHLTNISDGTMVNDPSKNITGLGPLSRYGSADTAHHRGECLNQVDVNDLKDPPVVRAVPVGCSAN